MMSMPESLERPKVDLLASAWTTAGNAKPMTENEESPYDLRSRIEAAAGAGYRGFGIVHADLAIARRQMGLRTLRAILGGCATRGLQNRLRGADEASWVGSIPIHPRHLSLLDIQHHSYSLAFASRHRRGWARSAQRTTDRGRTAHPVAHA